MLIRNKMTLLFSAAMMLCVSLTNNASAQGSNSAKTVQIGNINAGAHSTAAAVLSQSKLVVSEKNYVVSAYTISLKDAATSKNYFGPVTVAGAALTNDVKDQIKKHEHNKCVLSFENVQVMGMGAVTHTNNFSVTLDAK